MYSISAEEFPSLSQSDQSELNSNDVPEDSIRPINTASKSKKFIDKKNATTFVLGHRSQRDPLAADETAPQRVLIPVDQAGASTSAPGTSSKGKKVDPAKRKEEQQKYGIYFDDDYDYLQHLKDSKEVSNIEWDVCERVYASELQPKKEIQKKADIKDVKLKLPSSVFESEYVEEIGLLNKAAPNYGPRPDLDPDVIAALDDDFDFDNPENSLEDNFMELAGVDADDEELQVHGRALTKEDIEGLFSDEDESMEEGEEDDEDRDTICSMDGPHYNFSDDGEENKSHFTNYSMSSSVIRRNEQLTLLDDRFEKMYEEYEDTEIGALDCDEIEGFVNPESDLLLQCAEEFEKECEKEKELHERIVRMGLEESDDSESTSESDTDEEKEKWDCESILSTYSNTKNRPRLIKEPSKRNMIKVSGKTGMPVGVLGAGLTEGKLKELDREYAAENGVENASCRARSMISSSSVWKPRPKEETPEERAERKRSIKEYRRERRQERKANADAFKEEKKRQVKVRLNTKANTQGLKL